MILASIKVKSRKGMGTRGVGMPKEDSSEKEPLMVEKIEIKRRGTPVRRVHVMGRYEENR